jgi:hypothetical protein
MTQTAAPKPLTAKRERFCQLMAEGKTQADAYREAFGGNAKAETIYKRASELMALREIQGRVAELRKPVIEQAQLTLADHLEELRVLRDAALKDGRFSAAIQAEIARGKACGHYIIKVEDVTDPLKKAMQNMTPEQAESMLNALDQAEAAMRGKGGRAGQPA